MLIELRKLYDLGFSLIPIEPGGKRPLGSWKEYQSVRRSWELIEEEHRPGMNWAVVCGRVSDLVVVDVDPRNGGDVQEVLTEIWGPHAHADSAPTMVVQTGGGGWHLYFRLDGRDLPSVPSWRKGVDLQSEGKYVVAPGSLHPSGKYYITLREQLTSAPGVLWTPRRQDPHPDDAQGEADPWIARTIEHPEDVKCGVQEETMNRLAWFLAGTVPVDIARSTLRQWAQGLTQYDPSWPWTADDVDRHIDSAFAKREREPRLRVAGLERRQVTIRDKDHVPLKEQVMTARAFCEEQTADIPWIVEGMVAPGCMTEVIGSVKAGKSTFVCGMLWALLNGEEWLGKKTEKTPVLYVTEQAGVSFRKTLTRGRIQDSEDLYILTPKQIFGLDWDQAVGEIVETAEAVGARLIVVDTLARLAGLAGDDENSSGVAMRVLRPFQAIKAKNMAVVFVRHGRKSGGALNELGRGSNAYSGEMDVIVGLKVIDQQHKAMEVSGRLDEPYGAVLEYQNGTYVIGLDPGLGKGKENEAKRAEVILESLSEGGPASAYELGKRLGMGHRTVTRVLAPLVGGEVQKEGKSYKIIARLDMTGVEDGAA